MIDNWQPQLPATELNGGPVEGGPDRVKGSENETHGGSRKKIVVVGLGMVGISFMLVFRSVEKV
jgi:nitrite reductase (NAD(P)H)